MLIIILLMFDLEKCIEPRKEPNKSFKLGPLSNHPSHSHNCTCEMCNAYESVVMSKMLQKNSEQIFSKLKQRQKPRIVSSSFEYILKRLIAPHNKIVSQAISIFIPQVCFYKDGEADSLYMNVDPFEKSNFKDLSRDKKDPIIARLKKEKLTNTQIQKVFNQKRRKYRQKVGTAQKRKLSRKLSQFGKKEPVPQTKDAVIITYIDGYEQLQTQNQFINLTLKRKQDPIFKKIQFIKNFIGVVEEDKRILVIKHDDNAIKYEKLFQRSKTLMRCFATNILPGDSNYISSEDQSKFGVELQKLSTDAFAHYTLYKIINFIQCFYDEKITSIKVKFLLNQCQQLYLLHVYQHTKVNLVGYTWTQDTYLKKVGEEQNRFLLRRADLNQSNLESHNRSSLIQTQMFHQYQKLKNIMGLGQVQKNDSQQKANNAFFASLYPSLNEPISQVLREKGMTVTKFQEKYLGYRNKKKSVAQQFNSNLVKTLYKMAPRLKVAKGHQIQDKNFPKTPTISIRSAKRSFSLGTTFNTLNKTKTIYL